MNAGEINLQQLFELGKDKPSIRYTRNTPLRRPANFDEKKFQRGQRFFQNHLISIILSWICSLTCGFSIINLLDPLVFTNKSKTPKKSLFRYIETLIHLINWHFDDIWNCNSDSAKSLKMVKLMHDEVGAAMTKTRKDGVTYVSQYDLSLVQSGFIAPLLLNRQSFGITCTDSELDDYLFCWQFFGYHLGITNENNVCCYGLKNASKICEQLETEILQPALMKRPKDFHLMASSFTQGLNLINHFTFYTPDSIINWYYDIKGKKRSRLSLCEEVRIFIYKTLTSLILYSAWFKRVLNKLTMYFYHMNVKAREHKVKKD